MEHSSGRRQDPIVSVYVRLGDVLTDLTFPDAPEGQARLDSLHVCQNAFFRKSSSPQVLGTNSDFPDSCELARKHPRCFRQLPEDRQSHSPSRLIRAIVETRSFVEAAHRQKFVFHTTTVQVNQVLYPLSQFSK